MQNLKPTSYILIMLVACGLLAEGQVLLGKTISEMPGKDHENAEKLLKSAHRYLSKGQLEMAWADLSRSADFADSAEKRLELAKLDIRMGDKGDALEEVNRGLKLPSENADLHNVLLALKKEIIPALMRKHNAKQKALAANDLKSFIKASGFSPALEEALLKNLKPSFRLYSQPDPTDSKKSKLGGIPDVPANFQWPRNQHGKPLAFICQIDPSALPRKDFDSYLPSSGLLSFFYDAEATPSAEGGSLSPESRKFIADNFDKPEKMREFAQRGESTVEPYDRRSARVFHFVGEKNLAKAKVPHDLPAECRFRSCAISCKEELTFPCGEAIELRRIPFTRGERADCWDLNEWYADHTQTSFENRSSWQNGFERPHRLLGNAQIEQSDFRPNLQGAAPEDWELLLQVASDDSAGMMWGDVGLLYFCMPRKDLQKRNFDSVVVVMQCG